jgi:hypothetical protein
MFSGLAAYPEVLFFWSRSLVALPRCFVIKIKGNYLWFTTLTDPAGPVSITRIER